MKVPAITRKPHAPALATRNLLADFDTLVERAVLAGMEGRNAEPLIDEAVRVASALDAFGLCEEHQRAELLDRDVVARFLRMAARPEIPALRAQFYARSAKGYVRARTCDHAKRDVSFTGRPVW